MSPAEREMIYEINRVRNDPASYLPYLVPMLKDAQEILHAYGNGAPNYSLTYTTERKDGREIKTVDTTWHNINEERVKALSTLIEDLKKLTKLSVLFPDRGIYRAARKHAADQRIHNWQLMHTGSDGSNPWNRIITFSPQMTFGNENIAGRTVDKTAVPRDIVLQLLIDEGIPGYGHRYNLLDPQWTHVACTTDTFEGMWWWIQNFGIKRGSKK